MCGPWRPLFARVGTVRWIALSVDPASGGGGVITASAAGQRCRAPSFIPENTRLQDLRCLFKISGTLITARTIWTGLGRMIGRNQRYFWRNSFLCSGLEKEVTIQTHGIKNKRISDRLLITEVFKVHGTIPNERTKKKMWDCTLNGCLRSACTLLSSLRRDKYFPAVWFTSLQNVWCWIIALVSTSEKTKEHV